MADDLTVELGDEGQLVDDRAVGAQAADQLALDGLPSPLWNAEGGVVQLSGRARRAGSPGG
uniref:Uncharacterized protein n=1 Tax=Janibacter limosus TaxID=53458 RepID=A0AC61U604_9MICO|nr:hypothetical protein [Janibacter limosus]